MSDQTSTYLNDGGLEDVQKEITLEMEVHPLLVALQAQKEAQAAQEIAGQDGQTTEAHPDVADALAVLEEKAEVAEHDAGLTAQQAKSWSDPKADPMADILRMRDAIKALSVSLTSS